MQSLLADLIDSIFEMPSAFTEVALQGPVSAILVALGTLLFLATFGVFGYLALGAFVDVFTPDVSGRAPTQANR